MEILVLPIMIFCFLILLILLSKIHSILETKCKNNNPHNWIKTEIRLSSECETVGYVLTEYYECSICRKKEQITR